MGMIWCKIQFYSQLINYGHSTIDNGLTSTLLNLLIHQFCKSTPTTLNLALSVLLEKAREDAYNDVNNVYIWRRLVLLQVGWKIWKFQVDLQKYEMPRSAPPYTARAKGDYSISIASLAAAPDSHISATTA